MSDVWEFFEKIRNNENIIVSLNCQLCEVLYGASTSTSTLRRHLMKIHYSVYTPSNNQQTQSSPYTPEEQSYITIKLAQ